MNTFNVTFTWLHEFNFGEAPAKLAAAKMALKEKGWSYRRVAPLLGVHHVHLALVMGGHRQSLRILRAIAKLPHAPAK